MCGIFGFISNNKNFNKKIKTLVKHSGQRGKDSSGLIYFQNETYQINRANYDINKLFKKVNPVNSTIVLGHSRLITNGLGDNQPVIRKKIAVLHNGIILNENEVWSNLTVQRHFQIDSELIVAIAE
jgi:glucosamine--fructose-6-phosphate aminotransferase (isomerizing)